MNRPKHIIEYAALRIIGGLVNLLPLRGALGLGWILAWIAFYVVQWRVDTAKARIHEVFGNKYTEKEIKRIAWISLRNMFFNAIEVIRIPSLSDKWIEKHTNFPESESGHKIKAIKNGAIMALPHMGSWDMGGVAASMVGVKIFFITGKQKNPLFDQYVNKMRGFTGIATIPRDSKSLLKQVIRNLKTGKVLAFTNDLRSKTEAMRVQFLGKEANIVGGMALFARMADVSIFPLYLIREGWTYHKVKFAEPLHPDKSLEKEQDWQRITQKVMDFFTEAVKEHPEQYFWYNKRWVLDPL